jgi:hypothetical protein
LDAKGGHDWKRFDIILIFALGSLATGSGFAVTLGCATVTLCALLAASTIALRPERTGRIRFWVWLRFRRRAWERADVVGRGISISLRHVHPLRTCA